MSYTIVCGMITSAARRQKRNSDGVVFAIVEVRDRDRFDGRDWTVFVNDINLIERFEGLRVGEPVAISGPFAVKVEDRRKGAHVEYRLTALALLDAKRPKKSKTAKRLEEREASDVADDAPREAADPDDPVGL